MYTKKFKKAVSFNFFGMGKWKFSVFIYFLRGISIFLKIEKLVYVHIDVGFFSAWNSIMVYPCLQNQLSLLPRYWKFNCTTNTLRTKI